jgi:O-antigen/teichoic acid export membrane protein
VVIAAVGGSVVGAVWGWVVPYALAFVVLVRMGLPIVRRKSRADPRPDSDESTSLERGLTRWFWAFTAPRAVANLGQMVLQRMDIVLVAAIRGPRDAAVYAAATRFLVLGQAAGMSISLAVEPSLGMAIGARDTVRASKVYRTGTTWLILVTWPVYLFCMVAPTLVLSVFGRAFDAGAPVIVLLAATMLVATGVGMVDFVLAMAGRTLWNLANVILAVAVFLVLEVVLIPTHGIVGAAIGWSAAILVNNLVPLAQVTGWLHIHPYGRSTLVAAGWVAVSCGLLPLLLLSFGSRTIPEMIGVLLVSGLVYAVGLWPWRSVLLLDQLPWPGRKRRSVIA